MAGRPIIPEPTTDDDEDVSWALSTASALHARGEAVESLKWLRRAAETASDANRDMRAVELFKAAADMAGEVERAKSQLPPPPSQAPPSRGPSQAPPSSSQVPPPPQSSAPPSGESRRAPPPPPPVRISSLPPASARPAPPSGDAGKKPPPPAIPSSRTPPPPVGDASSGARGRRVEPYERTGGDRSTMAGVGAPPKTPPSDLAAVTIATPARRARTASRTKGLVSLSAGRAKERERTPSSQERTPSRDSVAEPPKSASPPTPEPSSVRPRREDEITARHDFSALRAGVAKLGDAPAEGAVGGGFDEEQTHVLGGEESFVDLGSPRREKPVVDEETPAAPPADSGTRNGALTPHQRPTVIMEAPAVQQQGQRRALVARLAAFRVVVIADEAGLHVRALRSDETVGSQLTALLVPSDEAASDAILNLLARGDER